MLNFNRIEEDAASKHENEEDVEDESIAKVKEQVKEEEQEKEKEKSAEDSPIKEQKDTAEPMETDETKPAEPIEGERPSSSGKRHISICFSFLMFG